MFLLDRNRRSFEEEFFHSTNEDIWNLFDKWINDPNDKNNVTNPEKDENPANQGLKRLNSASFGKGLTVHLQIPESDQDFVSRPGFIGFKVHGISMNS